MKKVFNLILMCALCIDISFSGTGILYNNLDSLDIFLSAGSIFIDILLIYFLTKEINNEYSKITIYTVEDEYKCNLGMFLSFSDAAHYLNMVQTDYGYKQRRFIKKYVVENDWNKKDIILPVGKVKSCIGFVKTVVDTKETSIKWGRKDEE